VIKNDLWRNRKNRTLNSNRHGMMIIWNDGTLPEGLTLDALKRSHSSRPRNPIIADVSFKGGYIDAWGRGTIKILDTCRQAELPEPEMQEQDGGFIMTLFKNKLTKEQLSKLGLNPRQIKAVFFVKEFSKITNKRYQEINSCSRNTASKELIDLTNNKKTFVSSEQKGAGSFYFLK
jgi:ATP-dependent DNA helicase RecG